MLRAPEGCGCLTGSMLTTCNAAGTLQESALVAQSLKVGGMLFPPTCFPRDHLPRGQRATVRLTAGTQAIGQPVSGRAGSSPKVLPADLGITFQTSAWDGWWSSIEFGVKPSQPRARDFNTNTPVAFALASLPRVMEKACGNRPARAMAVRTSLHNLAKAYHLGDLNSLNLGDLSSLLSTGLTAPNGSISLAGDHQGGNGSEGSSVGKAPTFVTGAGACEDWLKFPYSDAPHEKRFTASTTKGVPLASVMPPLDEIDTDRLGCQPFSSLDASPGALLGASFTSCGGSKVAETGDAVLPVAPRHPWSLSSPAPPLMVKMPSSQNIINTADAAVVNGALRPTPINAHGVTNWVDPMINGHCDTDATCMTLGTSSKRRRIDTALLPVQQLATCSAAGSCKMASPGVAIVDVSTPSASCFQDVTMPASSSGEQVVKRMSLSDSNVAEMVELPSSDWPSFNSDVDIDMTDDELRSWLSDL